jgi:hypothetical protein
MEEFSMLKRIVLLAFIIIISAAVLISCDNKKADGETNKIETTNQEAVGENVSDG